jgi:hypothetical protein
MPGADTAKSARRSLRFGTIDDALTELDRVVEADKAGKLRRTGNWSTGQTLGHVAAWIDYGYDGYPMRPPPFFIRWILKRKLKQMLAGGMPAGVRIPGVAAGTYGIETLSLEEGATRLRRAFQRLKGGEPAKFDSPAFGPMSHEDRVRLNLRHAELHLGFLSYA